MIGLFVAGFAGLIIVLYAADLIVKARARARRLRRMSGRLAAATARAEQQHRQRQAAARASGALTSVLPAITRPPGDPAHSPVPPRTNGDHPGPAHERPAREAGSPLPAAPSGTEDVPQGRQGVPQVARAHRKVAGLTY